MQLLHLHNFSHIRYNATPARPCAWGSMCTCMCVGTASVCGHCICMWALHVHLNVGTACAPVSGHCHARLAAVACMARVCVPRTSCPYGGRICFCACMEIKCRVCLKLQASLQVAAQKESGAPGFFRCPLVHVNTRSPIPSYLQPCCCPCRVGPAQITQIAAEARKAMQLNWCRVSGEGGALRGGVVGK